MEHSEDHEHHHVHEHGAHNHSHEHHDHPHHAHSHEELDHGHVHPSNPALAWFQHLFMPHSHGHQQVAIDPNLATDRGM